MLILCTEFLQLCEYSNIGYWCRAVPTLCVWFSQLLRSITHLQVMCPTCLCTGMAMASEHDPRIDPFDWLCEVFFLDYSAWICKACLKYSSHQSSQMDTTLFWEGKMCLLYFTFFWWVVNLTLSLVGRVPIMIYAKKLLIRDFEVYVIPYLLLLLHISYLFC